MILLPAIVLAAGLSSRMGAFKPLLPLQGAPLLHHVLNALEFSGGISEVLLITGHRASEIETSLQQYQIIQSALPALPKGQLAMKESPRIPIRILHNPVYATGEMLSSLLTGIDALPPSAPAFLLALADHPAVRPTTIAHLARTYFQHNSDLQCPARPIVVPIFDGKRGHPVIVSSALVSEIRSLAPRESLKTVVHRHLAHTLELPVDDPAVLLDLDTPADVDHAQAILSSANIEIRPANQQ